MQSDEPGQVESATPERAAVVAVVPTLGDAWGRHDADAYRSCARSRPTSWSGRPTAAGASRPSTTPSAGRCWRRSPSGSGLIPARS
jgi:hypothetical protein